MRERRQEEKCKTCNRFGKAPTNFAGSMFSPMTKMHFGTVYGLCHHMVRSRKTKSGYAPGIDHLGRNFTRSLRLAGFAALLNGGYADVLLLLGTTSPNGVHSAEAMRRYLALDLGVPRESIVADIHDYDDTQNSLKAVRKTNIVCTSFDHIPRASLFTPGIQYIPAEAALVATNTPFPRCIGNYLLELQGIADMLNGVHKTSPFRARELRTPRFRPG